MGGMMQHLADIDSSGISPRFHQSYTVQGECWIWNKSKDRDGYGRIKVRGVRMPAYMVGYWLYVGIVPDHIQLHHVCRNRLCVNPYHLLGVTPQEHTRYSIYYTRTECPRGHPYPGGIFKKGMICKTCEKMHNKRAYERKKQRLSQSVETRPKLPEHEGTP